jgi:hypothetical protein
MTAAFRRMLKNREILFSSFDKLRMRLSVLSGLNLMVSLSNHGQHLLVVMAALDPRIKSEDMCSHPGKHDSLKAIWMGRVDPRVKPEGMAWRWWL